MAKKTPAAEVTPTEKALDRPDLNDPNVRLPRDEAMALMSASRREAMEKEAAEGAAPVEPDEDIDKDDAAAEAARLEAESKAETQIDKQAAEETILADEDLPNYRVKVKVNGREEFRSLEELRAAAQKTEAADQYLAAAKEMLRAVKEQQEAAPKTTDATAEKDSPALERAKKLMGSIFAGDEEEATKMIAELMGRETAIPNFDELASRLEQRIVNQSALRQFKKDHKFADDEIGGRLVDTYLLKITGGRDVRELPPEEAQAALDEATKMTQALARRIVGEVPSETRATTRIEKRAMKQGIDELPAAATRAASTVAPPQTAESVIERMRIARGQVSSPPS